VATDLASRGIHVQDIVHVINYDLPKWRRISFIASAEPVEPADTGCDHSFPENSARSCFSWSGRLVFLERLAADASSALHSNSGKMPDRPQFRTESAVPQNRGAVAHRQVNDDCAAGRGAQGQIELSRI
jgi:hypothetical protein